MTVTVWRSFNKHKQPDNARGGRLLTVSARRVTVSAMPHTDPAVPPRAYAETHLSITQVCEAAGISPSGLRWLRATGKGPEHVIVGRRTLFRKEVIEKWLAERSAT